MNGIIIKAIGGIYFVEAPEGIFECKARGIFRQKKISPMCGDIAEISVSDNNTGIIESISKRRSELIRPPLANLDILVLVTSTCEPKPNLLLLDKFIAIAEYKKIMPVLAFTKIDKKSCDEISEIYKKSGIKVFEINNTTGSGSTEIRNFLDGKLSAFAGNTGVGKSSLMNNIFPDINFETGEISKKLGRGKHTTRHVQLYKLKNGGYIADTPGFSSFDTNKYDIIFKDELADCFVEFSEFKDKCRFPDCSHTKEKGCAVIDAVNNGIIPKSRHESYLQMYEEAKQLKKWEYKNE